MSEQYFTANPSVPSKPREVKVRFRDREYEFATDSGVFSKGGLDAGTELLLKALPALGSGQRGLDLGCGWGPVGAIWATACPLADFVMTDVNERAADLAAKNAKANGAENATATHGDALEPVTGDFDAIALNPPIRTGKENIYRMFRQSMERLRAGGALYIVIRVKQGADSAKKMLLAEYGNCETVTRGGGYHVLKCERRGL